MGSTFKDHFSDASAAYRRFRPTYPRELFEWLADRAPGTGLAWDCATGNGQAAAALRSRFEHVVATDASETQIAEAAPAAGVDFRVAPAERSGLGAESVDLVTVAQALHWFDIPAFFAEARRVLKPRGVIAAWTYQLTRIRPDVDAMVRELAETTLGEYWPPERALVDEGYAGIEFPFEPIGAPRFEMSAQWDLPTLAGYLRTWSSTKRFVAARGYDPVTSVEDALGAVWPGGGSLRVRVAWPLPLRVGRK